MCTIRSLTHEHFRAQPIEGVTTVATATGVSTDRLNEGIDMGWDAAEKTVKGILNPVVNLIAQVSDLVYFALGASFVGASTYALRVYAEYSCESLHVLDMCLACCLLPAIMMKFSCCVDGPATNTMYTMGILVRSLLASSCPPHHMQLLRRHLAIIQMMITGLAGIIALARGNMGLNQ